MLTTYKLKINMADKQSAVSLADYYAKYYEESGERPGNWYGGGADALNLTGQKVTSEALKNLFLGKTPDGKSQLVRVRIPKPKAAPQEGERIEKKRKKEEKEPELHVPGFDLTFSPPKSVTALWAVSDDATRSIIEQCIHDAATERIDWIQSELDLARRGKAGCESISSGLVVGRFTHTTARNAGDPQFHEHAVFLNLCLGEDGEWSKIDSRLLFTWTRTQGPLFRNSVMNLLSERLGVEGCFDTENGKRKDWFELKGVPETLLSRWSSRRKEILKETELLPGIRSSVKARQNANLRTRKSKEKSKQLDENTLRDEWRKEANRQGFTERIAQSVMNRQPRIDVAERVKQAVIDAGKRCTEDQAYFTRQRFIQRVSEELQDVPISGNEVMQRAEAALKSEMYVELKDEKTKRLSYTTREMWELEQKMLADVQTLRATPGAKVSARAIEKVLQRHQDLSPDQARAARALLDDKSSLKTMTGVAGAGKTRTLGAVVKAYEQAGYKVLGGALAGTATEELASKANIDSRTVAKYNYHLNKPTRQKIKEWVKHEAKMFVRQMQGKSRWEREAPSKLNQKTVLILDEAGMLDTRSAAPLIRNAEKSGATLILVGDNEQLSPIGAGGPFRNMTKDGATCHLAENFRQRNSPDDAKAAASVREGRIDEMLESYAHRGRLKVARNRTEAAGQLVTEWARDGGISRPQDAMILTQTRAEAKQINKLCQEARRLEGTTSSKSIVIENQIFYVDDRVLFHKKMYLQGIENGSQARIVAVDLQKKTITVNLDRAPSAVKAMKGHQQTVTLAIKDLTQDQLTLGYAATTHKLQGQSVKHAYCLLGGGMTNKELTYVQLTRGEQSTKLFIDRNHAGRKLADIAEAIQQSGKKRMAHDLTEDTRLRLQIKRPEKES